jgi:hypothetical protein
MVSRQVTVATGQVGKIPMIQVDNTRHATQHHPYGRASQHFADGLGPGPGWARARVSSDRAWPCCRVPCCCFRVLHALRQKLVAW